jgi:hypothetical protein
VRAVREDVENAVQQGKNISNTVTEGYRKVKKGLGG